MNTISWRRHYETNRNNRTEPDWNAPCLLRHDVCRALAVSLSHFQLGETGGGSFLLNEAAKETDADDLAALALFVQEEKEHARLLACMVQRLGGKLIQRHWSHRLFKFARRAGGFRFEIQMLLTAEIVGTAYYEMVNAAIQDTALNAALGLMLRDEAGHVSFHQDRLGARWRSYLPFERVLWSAQFQALVLAAIRVAWLDHGPCLRKLGYTKRDFIARTRQVAIEFLDGLQAQASPCQGCAPAPQSLRGQG